MIHFDVYLKIVQDHMKAFLDTFVPKTAEPIALISMPCVYWVARW